MKSSLVAFRYLPPRIRLYWSSVRSICRHCLHPWLFIVCMVGVYYRTHNSRQRKNFSSLLGATQETFQDPVTPRIPGHPLQLAHPTDHGMEQRHTQIIRYRCEMGRFGYSFKCIYRDFPYLGHYYLWRRVLTVYHIWWTLGGGNDRLCPVCRSADRWNSHVYRHSGIFGRSRLDPYPLGSSA